MSTLAVHNNTYRETKGLSYLSPTYQSDVIHTPRQTHRRTVSAENYERCRRQESTLAKPPWGRHVSYGGLGPVSAPVGFRPKNEPPIRVGKGHLHYGAGTQPHPREMKLEQLYDVTSLKKSENRINDELIPSMNKLDLNPKLINRRFPSNHPYTSHVPGTALFPSTEQAPSEAMRIHAAGCHHPPTDIKLPSECPVAAIIPHIDAKASGSMGRQEKVSIPLDTDRRPMSWPKHVPFYQVCKGKNQDQTWYYPIPSLIGYSNSLERPESEQVAEPAVKCQKELIYDYLKSTYQKDFSEGTAGRNTHLSLEDRQMTADDGRFRSDPQNHYPDSLIRNLQQANVDITAQGTAYGTQLASQYTPHSSKSELTHAHEPSADAEGEDKEKAEVEEEEEEEEEADELPAGIVLGNMRKNWSETQARRVFHSKFPDNAPSLRRFPDRRITEVERRHFMKEGNGLVVPASVWAGQTSTNLYPKINGRSGTSTYHPLTLTA